jgi:two-component system sensor histidine kinase BaeS
MGIRGRLLTLTLGVAVPLVVTGLVGLHWVWVASRERLDASVRKQAELAAAAFDGWIDAERQPLVGLAASEAGRPDSQPLTEAELRSVVRAHPHWLGVEEIDAGNRVVVSWPASAVPLSPEVVASLREDLARGEASAIDFNWSLAGNKPVLVIATPLDGGRWLAARVDATSTREVIDGVEGPPDSVITFIDPKHRIVQRSLRGEAFVGKDIGDSPSLAELESANSVVNEHVSRNDGVRRVYGTARVGTTGCFVGVGVPSAELYEPARAQFYRYLFFSTVALACAVVASMLIARKIVGPVRHLRDAAHGLGAGDLSVRAPDLGTGEMGELSSVFNRMAESLEEREAKLAELDRLKSEFVSCVSHEMRTPLTTIKTLTEVLRRGGETPEERARYLGAIATECDRQIDFVLDLLDLSRIEAGAFTVGRECVDVAEVVGACVESERYAAEAAGHEIGVDLPADLPYARAERAALRRVLRCLVENAVKYTPRGGRIRISAHEADGAVVVAVSDTGRGIAAADLPRVFERFYQGADGREVDSRGVGLGLYLARTIVEHLGGRITVESETGRGSTFSVSLPRWVPEPEGRESVQERAHAETSTGRR